MLATQVNEGNCLHQPIYGISLGDSEPNFSTSKIANRSQGVSENSLLKSFSADKERSNNVAKIKVVVGFSYTISMLFLFF